MWSNTIDHIAQCVRKSWAQEYNFQFAFSLPVRRHRGELGAEILRWIVHLGDKQIPLLLFTRWPAQNWNGLGWTRIHGSLLRALSFMKLTIGIVDPIQNQWWYRSYSIVVREASDNNWQTTSFGWLSHGSAPVHFSFDFCLTDPFLTDF